MASWGRAAASRQQPSSSLSSSNGASPIPSFPFPKCFGPRAPDVTVTPRRGEPGSDIKVQKPHTGMTIRLTTELLARLQQPGPKPSIELILKSAAEGGPVLVVDGVKYNTNAHQMAIGSEVHMVARTELAAENGPPENTSRDSCRTTMSMFASLHRKLIVQQVLTSAKRAEMRARTEGSAREIEEAKKRNMLVIDDRDEMLAAAEAIPTRQSQHLGVLPEPGGGGGQQRSDRKRPRPTTPTEAVEGKADPDGNSLRDPLTAWFYDCYNHDDYRGHVSDLHKFLGGIDVRHVMFRYHVKPDGTLDPDRRRFCVQFKTKGGRDLALKRSGEAFGAPESWSPERVPVIRGRDETADDAPTDFLLVLPQGSSVAEVLEKVKARLPQDLAPVVTQSTSSEQKRYFHQNNGRAGAKSSNARSEVAESYRRDMLRAALGASLAGADNLGAEWGAPAARLVGTDEDNAYRVATLAADEAARVSMGGEKSKKRLNLPSGPAGGARAQRREAIERAEHGEWQPVT